MSDIEPTQEQFLKHVAQHQLTVIRDDGVHRHLHFAQPGTRHMAFDIITWPGCLCYSGDMGTYVFQRLEDMLEFFRDERNDAPLGADHRTLHINLGYWAEKLLAVDRNGGVKEFCIDKFRDNVRRILDDCEASDATREAAKDELIDAHFDHEHEAYSAARDFQPENRQDRRIFEDFWEVNCRQYTYHYIWCCYALAWGIVKYDARKAEKLQEAA